MSDPKEDLPTLWIDIIKGFFATLGILGNILVLRVLLQRHMRITFNKLRCALAVFDTLNCMAWLLESILENSVIGYEISAYMVWPMTNFAYTASIFMTMAIAVERFLAINHLHKYRKNQRYRTTKYVCFVTITAILLNITKFFEFKEADSKKPKGTPWQRTDMYEHEVYRIYNVLILNLVIKGLIPITVLICTYAKIYSKVKENQIVRVKSKSKPTINANKHAISIILEHKRAKKQEKMARTFAGVVITSLVCNFPDMCVKMTVLASVNTSPDTSDDPLAVWLKVRDLFIILNSVANILIYTWLDTNFRQEFKKVFQNVNRGCEPGSSSTIPMTT